MILLIILMVVIAIILTLVDWLVPARPSWLLNFAVLLGLVAVLLLALQGGDPIHIDTN